MRLLTVILAMLLSGIAFAEEKNDSLLMAHLDIIDRQEIPADTSVRTGVLKNGLTYYVRRCTDPKQKADFCLMVKAGAVLEQDDEQGVAHFVEHVLFRGTKHFPGQEVIGFMRRNGIPFGHDSNAFTGCNTVRYLLNGIPTTDAAQMDSCLLMLRDWACDATMADADVESERGIIVEEWRMKNTISFSQQLTGELLNNSIYAKRLSIGDMDVIRNCPPKVVRRFYKRWYQPQNQAVVVKGDFDPDAMVAKIRELFGSIRRGKSVVPPQPAIPDADSPRIRFYQDSHLPTHSTSILIRLPDLMTDHKIGTLRSELVRDKVKDLMKNKLEALKTREIQSVSASFLTPADIKDCKFLALEMSATADKWKQTLETLLKAIEHTRRFGFTDYERKPGAQWVPAYNADSTGIHLPDTTWSNSVRSSEWKDKFYNHFFFGTVINDYRSERTCRSHIENTITQEQLLDAFRAITTGRNMLVAELFPAGATLPTEAEVSEVVERVRAMTDEELADMDVRKGRKLERMEVDSLHLDLTPGTVAKTTVRNDSITELRLSNGVKVLLWKSGLNDTTGIAHSLDMKFGRPLGYASLPDEAFHYQGLLYNCRRKFVSEKGGHDVEYDAFYDRLDTGTYSSNDSASFWNNAEQLLKMMYAALTTTEVDSVAAAEKLAELQANAVMLSSPLVKAHLKMQTLPLLPSRRNAVPTVEDVESMSVEGFRDVVRDYFSNFNGSTLILKGKFDTDTIMPLVLKYIGALPSQPEPVRRTVSPSDHFRTTDTVAVEKIENATPYCDAFMYYTWEKGYRFTPETHAHNQVLQSVMGTVLLNTLRIQHSDVYAVSCRIDDKQLPLSRMGCFVNFTCDPKQRERIAQDVDKLVREMADGDLITQDLIDGYVREREKHTNDTNWGSRYYDLTRELGDIVTDDTDPTYVKRVTPASLRAHLRQMLTKGNRHIGYLTTE